MKLLSFKTLAIGALFAAAIPATASVNLIQNGEFASGLGSGGAGNPGSFSGVGYGNDCNGPACFITDWTLVSGTVDWIGTYWTAPNVDGLAGGKSVDLDGLQQPGAIKQTVATTAGTVYLLSFYTNGNADGAPNPKNLRVSVDGTPASQDYGPVPYLPQDQSLANWTHEVYSFTASGSSTNVTFASLDTYLPNAYPGASFGPVIAGISLSEASPNGGNSSVTPEPAFYGLLGAGLAGMALLARRRRSA